MLHIHRFFFLPHMVKVNFNATMREEKAEILQIRSNTLDPGDPQWAEALATLLAFLLFIFLFCC